MGAWQDNSQILSFEVFYRSILLYLFPQRTFLSDSWFFPDSVRDRNSFLQLQNQNLLKTFWSEFSKYSGQVI